MPGIMLLLSIVLFYTIFGGNIVSPFRSVFNQSNSIDIISLLIGFLITTPIIGLVISTITHGLIFLFSGYSIFLLHTHPPKDILTILHPEDPNIKLPNDKFYWEYQAYIRANLNEQTIKYLERRWNFIWIHINNIAAIILGLFISAFIPINCQQRNEYSVIALGVYFFLLLYCIMAFRQIISLREDVLMVEENAVKRQ